MTVAPAKNLLKYIQQHRDQSFSITQTYAAALEKCRDTKVTHPDYQDLREQFVLTATRYGFKVFPMTIKFVDNVLGTMEFLVARKDGKSLIGHLGQHVPKCQEHREKGKLLEAMHNFVAGKLKNLRSSCKDKRTNLAEEQRELKEEAEKLRQRKFKILPPGSKNMEAANKRDAEVADLEIVESNIAELDQCCGKALDMVKFINTVLSKIMSEVAATSEGLGNLKVYEKAEPKLRDEYFQYIKDGMEILVQGLVMFGEVKVEYSATLAAIVEAEPPEASQRTKWDLAFQKYVKRAMKSSEDKLAEGTHDIVKV